MTNATSSLHCLTAPVNTRHILYYDKENAIPQIP
jgi:hypothetical protein